MPTDATEFLTNADDGDRGTYYPPNAANTPTVCKKFDTSGNVTASGRAANTNSALVIKVVEGNTVLPAATAPGTPNNSYGFVRFRARLN